MLQLGLKLFEIEVNMFYRISLDRFCRYILSDEFAPDALQFMHFFHKWQGEDPREGLRLYAEYTTLAFLNFPTFQSTLWNLRTGSPLRGVTTVECHGKYRKKIWTLKDGRDQRSVQDWIDEHDGTAFLLILFVCNARNHAISSKKSLILHPGERISTHWSLRPDKTKLRLYIPDQGYVT